MNIPRWIVAILSVAAGGLLMVLVGFPSPALFGCMIGGLAFAILSREPVSVPRWINDLGQVGVGIVVAGNFDWQALAALSGDLMTILAVNFATLVLSLFAGLPLLLHGVSKSTAALASVAGGASVITSMAEDLRADQRIVMVSQSLRVVVVILTLPVVTPLVFSVDPAEVAARPVLETSIHDYFYVAAAIMLGLLLSKITRRWIPVVLGGIVAGTVLGPISFFAEPVAPAIFAWLAFATIGANVGLSFTRKRLVAIGRLLPTILLVTILILLICAALGMVLAKLTGHPYLDAYLASTPGGLPAVLAMAAHSPVDITFISAVQTVRIVMIMGTVPLLARLLLR